MPSYTINITDDEKKCLDTVMVDIGEWGQNSVKVRAINAKEEILPKLYAHCNANGLSIAAGESAQIAQAYAVGIAHTASADGPSD